MNMKQFRYVLVLASEGSFSRAAETLGISQPSLSQYLKKIEKEVHAILFDRSGSEIRLTDAGRAYIDAGRKILDIERQMEGRISDIAGYKAGTLVVGISPHRAVCLMPVVIKRFNSLYPGIQVILDERTGHELLDGAEHGDYDLCITTAPVDVKVFDAVKIMDEEVVLASSSENQMAGNVLKRRKYPAVDIKVLNNAPIITLSQEQLMQSMLDAQCAVYGIHYRMAASCRSIEAQLAMVRAGLGMAMVPAGIDKFGDDGVKYYSIIQDLPLREIVVAFRKEQYLSKPMKDFIEVLKGIENE